jgi:hypothetical protein
MTDIAIMQDIVRDGGKKMDTDIMDLRLVGIVCMTALALGALIIDGDIGETLMTGIVGALGVAVGWLFAKAGSKVEE